MVRRFVDSRAMPSILALFIGLAGSVSMLDRVEAAESRVALLLIGDSCAHSREGMEEALKKVPSVRAVDLYSIPDHILIDVKESVAADQLAETVNALQDSGRACRAEAMKSCITADAMK